MFKFRQDDTFYDDLYDLETIERCLETVEFWKNELSDERLKGLEDESIKARTLQIGSDLELYFIKGERYRQKEATITEWQEQHRKLDELIEKAQEPKNALCPNCSKMMICKDRHLFERTNSVPRVLFFFECLLCKKCRGFFEDGKEYVPQPDLCPDCKAVIKTSFQRKGNIETLETFCSHCGLQKKETENITERAAEKESIKLKNQQLLTKYRVEFCLSPEDGADYTVSSNRLKEFTENLEKEKQRESDPDYKKVTALKKLAIFELEEFLIESLAKESYLKLILDKPVIDKFVIVSFTIQDANPNRKNNDSSYTLRRLMKRILEETNWRLMSEGVHYRLGYLSGRLKGYEQEEELLSMIKESKNNV